MENYMNILPLVNRTIYPNGYTKVFMKVQEPIDLPEEFAKNMVKRGFAELVEDKEAKKEVVEEIAKEEPKKETRPKRKTRKPKAKIVEVEEEK